MNVGLEEHLNIREQENVANLAKFAQISDMRTFPVLQYVHKEGLAGLVPAKPSFGVTNKDLKT